MIKCYKKLLILLVCIISSLSVQAQGYSKYDYLSMAMARFENGEYQEARSYIQKYASFELNDKEKKLAMDLSSKCKSCEDFINKANTEYIEGKLAKAESFYIKVKELNPTHPNIQQLIDKCHKVPTASAVNQNQEKTKGESFATPPSKTSKHSFSFNSFLQPFQSLNSIFQGDEYFAWNVLGAGYPWNVVTGFEYRCGIFGLFGDIGIDFKKIEVINVDKTGYNWDPVSNTTSPIYEDKDYFSLCKKTFRYAGGLKIYPYKDLFLAFGYGTIAQTDAEVRCYDFTFYDWDDDKAEKVYKMVPNGYGWLFNIGYNLVPDFSSKSSDFFLGVSGGFSYDVVNKEYAPSINLKIGVAWDMNR